MPNETEAPEKTRRTRTRKKADTTVTAATSATATQLSAETTESTATEKPRRTRAPRKKSVATAAEAAPVSTPKMSAAQSAELDRLITELNELAEELKKSAKYTPPPFSPQAMAGLLKENMGKFAPDLQVPILSELKQNLEGTKPEDLLNPDTWKGMWYILNYTAQSQSEQLKSKLTERLSAIPGASVIFDLKSSFEGAKPSDFLDINTWKGVAFILDHTVRTQANEMKKKLLGEDEE